MANTVFAEWNASKWIGVRPAIVGEHILRNGTATNATVILYTVPAGKTFLLFNDFCGAYWGAATGGSFFLIIRDLLDADVYRINWGGQTVAGVQKRYVNNRYIPIEVTAGFDIVITSDNANALAVAGIEGILIVPQENV